MVHDEGDVACTQEPCIGLDVLGIHQPIDGCFGIPPSSFREVLVLVLRFALPVINEQCSKDLQDLFIHLGAGSVTDEFVHGSPMPDNVFKSVDEFLVALHAIDVNDKRLPSDEYLVFLSTCIDGGYLCVDRVCCHGFVSSVDVAGRVGRLNSVANLPAGYDVGGPFRSVFESLLDLFGRYSKEVRTVAFVIDG